VPEVERRREGQRIEKRLGTIAQAPRSAPDPASAIPEKSLQKASDLDQLCNIGPP
jgi:hypothetical protein